MQPTAQIRSFADVLSYVNKHGILEEDFLVRFYAISWTLPDGKKTGTVAATAERENTSEPLRITIQPCSGFRATLSDGTPLLTMPIARLHGAVAGPDGLVRLAPTEARPNGLTLKNVRFQPAPFDCNFSIIEDVVVRYAVKYLGMEDYCYPEFAPDIVPGAKRLDYARVSEVQITSQNNTLRYVGKCLTGLMSGCLDQYALDEYEAWLAGGSLRNAIARTLKRSGLIQQSRSPRSA